MTTDVYVVIGVLAVATFALKAAGPVLLGGAEPSPGVERVISLFTPTLIAAIVATSTFADGRSLILDERALGVGAGLVALLLRAPMIVAGLIAAAVCAGARLLL